MSKEWINIGKREYDLELSKFIISKIKYSPNMSGIEMLDELISWRDRQREEFYEPSSE